MKSSYGVSECCCIRGSIVCRTLFILLEGGANPDAGDIFALSTFNQGVNAEYTSYASVCEPFDALTGMLSSMCS
jgi:hypothetical protein